MRLLKNYASLVLSTFAPVKKGTFARKMAHLPHDFLYFSPTNGTFALVKRAQLPRKQNKTFKEKKCLKQPKKLHKYFKKKVITIAKKDRRGQGYIASIHSIQTN